MPTQRPRITLLLCCILLSPLTGCAPSLEPSAEHTTPDAGTTTPLMAPAGTTAAALVDEALPEPRLRIDERTYQLGLVDPTEEVAHEFKIVNISDLPVRVRKGQTSCKCTMTELPEDELRPGQEVVVRVASKIEQNSGQFDHSAELLTDDPANEVVTLRIQGTVLTILGASPETLNLWDIKPHEVCTRPVTVYSKVWNAFELEDITLTEGWSYEVEPASAGLLEAMEARSGYRVTIRAPLEHSRWLFSAGLTLKAVPVLDGERRPDQRRELHVPISGRVKPRAEFISRKMWFGELRLGNFTRGQGARETLMLKLWDDETVMNVLEIESDPSFLEVRVEPLSPDANRGLYRVELTIPSSAPACAYRGDKLASITLKTDHPTAREITLPINFAISSQ